jgi:hypothetical protein
MSTVITSYVFRFLCIGLLYCICPSVYAGEVSFHVVPNTVPHDTATIIEVYFDPKEEDLNVLEGTLIIENAETVQISSVILETGGSVFSLWPVPPVYTAEDHAIRFTGGRPEGLKERGFLFRMRLFSKQAGTVTLSWIGGSAYRNDGVGTASGVSSRSLTTTLSYGEPNIISPSSIDTEPPIFDTVLVSQDPGVYEGKYFVSFHASDDISGVSRYTVVENQISTDVSGGAYVLLDQERKSRVILTAYDHAGNSVSVKVPTKYALVSKILLGILMSVVAGFVFLYIRRRRLFYRVR